MLEAPMPQRAHTEWAKEMILEFIDSAIKEKTGAGGEFTDMDDLLALRKQRDRIAKFLKLEQR
jgi:hypothetical protein